MVPVPVLSGWPRSTRTVKEVPAVKHNWLALLIFSLPLVSKSSCTAVAFQMGKSSGEAMLVDSKGPIVVMWTVQTSLILIQLVAMGAAMIYLRFVFVPLMMAYFLIFLMAPILDLLETRPYACPCGKVNEENPNIYETTYESKMLCISGYEDEKRATIIRSMAAAGWATAAAGWATAAAGWATAAAG